MTRPTPAQVMEALLDGNEDLFIVDNLISTGKAIIYVAQRGKLDADGKYALFELEKRFLFYARMLEAITPPPVQNGK
ncbi:MAG: hypothetical protein NTW29_06245 [Bacteroidetes bacterium]|nr:hypothetical protein [Bacteroidota bacterium]